MKRIALIGSTGSIGRQTIEVALENPDKFKIVAMAAESSHALFSEQLQLVKPEYAALANVSAAEKVTEVPAGTKFFGGESAALAVSSYNNADIVLVAAGGFAGLKYSVAAISAGKTLALANKETLVCGGDLVMPLAKKAGVSILPVDSEHSAIWQCLGFDLGAPFRRLIITASGGAFRNLSLKELENVTPQMALRHPTWNMGAKITIDSATLLNKGFEVIEAHHLFGADYNKITAVLHPQSIVHSMVEFEDGAVLAQLSYPTMKLPIQLALSCPKREGLRGAEINFAKALSLDFMPLKAQKFPCFELASECGRAGGTLPCALNAAGEVAVHAFLAESIKFTDIARVIEKVVSGHKREELQSFDQLSEVDSCSRAEAHKFIAALQ